MPKLFKNSPIREAVCEFRFTLSDGANVKTDLIIEEIKEFFPIREKGHTLQVQMKFDAKTDKPDYTKESSEFEQLFSADKKTLVQIDKGRLSIHKIKPYGSWEEFGKLIQIVSSSYIKNSPVNTIERIGLRYINDFDIPKEDFDLNDYFSVKPNLPDGLKHNKVAAFIVGLLFEYNESNDNAKLQLVDSASSPEKISYILDIDYFTLKTEKIDIASIFDWVEKAHKCIEEIFLESITDKTKELIT